MGSKDALRNRLYELQAPNAPLRLPLSGHARMRHRTLADIQSLRSFVQANKGRLLELGRSPNDLRPNEEANHTTMAMPPFMRNSNAQPLTLSRWQYDLLMEWPPIPRRVPVQLALERDPRSYLRSLYQRGHRLRLVLGASLRC